MCWRSSQIFELSVLSLCDAALTVSLSLSLQEQWVWGRSESEARERAAAEYGVDPDAVVLTRGEHKLRPQSRV